MGMGKRRKGRITPKRVKPDEVLSGGPVTFARTGRIIHGRSDWRPGEFEKMQKQRVERYPHVVAEIDALVAEIASLVSVLPPDWLLHRAWWELATRELGITSGSKSGLDHVVAMRMVDYIQSVIAALPSATAQRTDVAEEDWRALREKVGRLFSTTLLEYHVCASAQARATDPAYDPDFEEFKFRAQSYWCSVRGTRYQVHQPAYLRDMFLPFSDVLQELFGITAEEFVTEITNIWRSLSYGIGEAFEAFDSFKNDALAAAEEKIKSGQARPDQDARDVVASVVEEHGWQERQDSALGRMLGFDLFDVEKVTRIPQRLLYELTWSPGEEREFFSPGPFRGWPLRIWPIFKRPFIRLNGRYFCFDLYGLFDSLYRVMQRTVKRLKPEYEQTWNRAQQQLSEALPFKYLCSILVGAKEFRPVFYPARTGSGTEWCEADGLLAYDDHLFVVEVRAGAFTYTPPATDFPAYVASLKNLVLKPATQGKRFLDYLNSADRVPIFDRDHRQIGTLRRADYRHVTVCAVTIDPFTELAAQVQHLRKIGVDVGTDPLWSLSVDDLRAYADVLDNPLVFLHYVEQRMQAFRSDIIQSDDEFDHLGLYLKHNHYATHARQLRGDSGARITFAGYRSEIDEFFNARMKEEAHATPPRQKITRRLFEIVDRLSGSETPGRSKVASYLLDLSGEAREGIAKGIDDEIERQPSTRRPKPLSTPNGDVALTIFCWTPSCPVRDSALALKHGRTVLLAQDEPRRLLLELTYSAPGELNDVSWHWIELANIPEGDLPTLRTDAERLREKRVASATGERGKIGRNDPCPCGSGKKYKRCHLGR
jgi:hypothetical protein